MQTKEDILNIFKVEFARTLKVMRAFPENKLDFTPHERSRTAKSIMSTFIFEMYLMRAYVLGENIDRSKFQTYSPDNLETLIKDFEKESSEVISKVGGMPDENLKNEVEFAGRKMSAGDFLQMMLFDQIHHRGQMSVYIRLAGGKVPSIYGPSADDPGTKA
jgi:uncharacterized damage-inducible protein DinB